MPRRYAQIDKMMPDMFHLYVTWFKPCIPESQDEKKWFAAVLPIACGSLVLECNKFTFSNRAMLSHLISNGITKQQFEIYPRKGEVWVLYRDWAIGCCSNPLVTKNCDFQMVEIITDYLEDLGVTAAYLAKVAGYKNVYCRYLERGNVLSINIPRKTLFMFSHNVPAFRFEGGEIDGTVKGMLELDPLAVPDNLFQYFSSAIATCTDAPCLMPKVVNCYDNANFTRFSSPSVSTTDSGGSSTGILNHKSKRSAKNFKVEQVWAVYDGLDAMPRSYVKVTNVVSPCRVSVNL